MEFKDIIIIVVAAAFSIAWGQAMKRANLPDWIQFTILAIVLCIATVLLTSQGG